MYKNFHLKLTLFSTFITGLILVLSTFVCLSLSEKEMEKNNYISFLDDLNTMLTHMESQTVISHQWLSKLETGKRFLIQIYDDGKPLFYQTLKRTEKEYEQLDQATAYAKSVYGLDVLSNSSSQILSKHQEFSMEIGGKTCYVGAAILSKTAGHLGVIVLSSTENMRREMWTQRIFFSVADFFALIALFFFSWFFTGRMIRPLEENRLKQTQFIASASHELRTPLAVILSSLSALEKSKGRETARFIHIIHSEGKRMSGLIDDMLLLAGSETKSWRFAMEETEPDTLLLDIYEKYEQIAQEKKIRLDIGLPEDYVPSCVCDPQRVTQVLSILLDNAMQYTPMEGRVKLSLSVSGKYTVSGKHLEFCVSDTGIGVPDTEKKKIFDRFYRTDSSHTDKEHFGLGLCVAKEIVKAHKGKIWVEDNQPIGAKFYFILPQEPL